ncbi:MAG: hypothetical protein HY665_05665, partial [Chloroflexi bacterium]|nr:hypothetical protein [Chloroflexota bacterium]
MDIQSQSIDPTSQLTRQIVFPHPYVTESGQQFINTAFSIYLGFRMLDCIPVIGQHVPLPPREFRHQQGERHLVGGPAGLDGQVGLQQTAVDLLQLSGRVLASLRHDLPVLPVGAGFELVRYLRRRRPPGSK